MRRRVVTQRASQPAAASHSLPARAPTAPHLAQHTSHATLARHASPQHIARRPFNTPRTQDHGRPDAPRRGGPFSPPPPHTRLWLARRPHLSVRSTPRARNTPRTNLEHRSLSHAHTHQREIRRAARSTLPAHRRLALASNSRADRTIQFAKQHAPAHCAPSPPRTRAHTSVRNTPRTHHVARLAPHTAHTQRSPSAPPRSPSAHAPRLASSPAR